MSLERIFRVNADSGLNLRMRPTTSASVLAGLKWGQAVVRMDDVDYDGWFYVFADTPGYGIFLGFAHAGFLSPITQEMVPVAESVAPTADDTSMDEGRGEDESPAREGVTDAGVRAGAGGVIARVLEEGWHPDVPESHRHRGCKNWGERRGGDRTVHRVILHVTGTESFQGAHNRFMNPAAEASAHYLVDKDGSLHQYVREDKRAWHAGISKPLKALYNRGDGSWRKYLYYKAGVKIPSDRVLLDANANPLPEGSTSDAFLAARPDGAPWPHFQYFDRKWNNALYPLGFDNPNHDPNNNSVGIEIRSIGASSANPAEYTDAMYEVLKDLVHDICARHGLPVNKETVCGHEDVNPVARWGWDPGQGFDWDRVISGYARDLAGIVTGTGLEVIDPGV